MSCPFSCHIHIPASTIRGFGRVYIRKQFHCTLAITDESISTSMWLSHQQATTFWHLLCASPSAGYFAYFGFFCSPKSHMLVVSVLYLTKDEAEAKTGWRSCLRSHTASYSGIWDSKPQGPATYPVQDLCSFFPTPSAHSLELLGAVWEVCGVVASKCSQPMASQFAPSSLFT